MWFAPKSSQVLRVWHETSLWKSWMDLPEVLCLLMAYLSLPSATRVIRRFVRSQGVPESHAGLRGITGNLDRRQDRREEATKTGRKTAALGLALLLGPHRSPGTLTWKHSPLRVFNKCHLTLGEALAVSPPLWRNEDLLWIWAVGGAYLHTGRKHQGFHGCLPALVLSLCLTPHLGRQYFSSVVWVAFIRFTKTFTYFPACVHVTSAHEEKTKL